MPASAGVSHVTGSTSAQAIVEVPTIRATAAGYLTEKNAALYLGCSARWLRERRARDELPDYTLLAGRVWYHLEDLNDYLDQQKVRTSR